VRRAINRLSSFAVGDARRALTPQSSADGLILTEECVRNSDIAPCGCRTDYELAERVDTAPPWETPRMQLAWRKWVVHRGDCKENA